jgi:Lrp/AsnC family leucine-responsive transcriptional regulator
MTLDHTDIELLKLIQKDSSMTNKEMAEKVNLSPTPVFERIKKLEQMGYIKGYVGVLDKEKIGLNLTVFCSVKIKEHTKEIGNKFVKDIVLLEEVVECFNIAGDYDFLLKVITTNMKTYQDFVINRLGEIENIGSTHSTFVMGEIKNQNLLPL